MAPSCQIQDSVENQLDIDKSQDCFPTHNIPWYDAVSGIAYVKNGDKEEASLTVLDGPNGIAIACFAHCAPMELPGITNNCLKKGDDSVPSQGEIPGPKRSTKRRRVSKKRPASALEPSTCSPENLPKGLTTSSKKESASASEPYTYSPQNLPEGWTTSSKKVLSGGSKGRSYRVWVNPDGKEFDRWGKVEEWLKANVA